MTPLNVVGSPEDVVVVVVVVVVEEGEIIVGGGGGVNMEVVLEVCGVVGGKK